METYQIKVKAVELLPETTQSEQEEKIMEEMIEFIESIKLGINIAEEACDVIQSIITYIDLMVMPFGFAWDEHTKKMVKRGFKARIKKDS